MSSGSPLNGVGETNGVSQSDLSAEATGGELKQAISIATAKIGQDLRTVGNQLLNIESEQRETMDRLERIAVLADERMQRRFEAVQQQIQGVLERAGSTQRQLQSAQEDIQDLQAIVRGIPDQLQATGEQCRGLDQRLQGTEQNLQGTEQRLQAAEQRLHGTEDKLQAAEQEFQGTKERLEGAQQQLRSAEQQLQTAEQQLQGVQQQLKDAEQQIRAFERRVATNGAQLAEIKSMFDDQATRRANAEISIGALAQEIARVRAEFPKLTEDDQSVQAVVKSSRRMQRAAVAASILTFLVVGYIGLGKPSWPILASFVAQWLPAGAI